MAVRTRPLQVRDAGRRLVVTDSTRADFETVKRVFAEYLDVRGGGKRLAEKLTREGVNPPGRADPRERHGGTWRRKHIQQLLTSQVYAGHVVYDGEIVARDAHPAAITDNDFVRVAAIRKLRERAKTEGSNGHNPIRLGEHGLFTPWLRCGTCGGRICVTVGGRSGKADYYYYVCATRQENKGNCLGLTVRVDVMDPGLLDYIASEVLTKENVRGLIDRSVIDLGDAPDSIAMGRSAPPSGPNGLADQLPPSPSSGALSLPTSRYPPFLPGRRRARSRLYWF